MLNDLLTKKKNAILKRWFQSIIDTYHPDAANFLTKQKDRFANPVGYTLTAETENIFNALIAGDFTEPTVSSLENIIRIRSVQEFSPSQAVSFAFFLKKAIREELKPELKDVKMLEELTNFETTIDRLALIAFDIYSACREKLYDIKVKEIKSRSYKIMERTNIFIGNTEQEENNDNS
jgi:hypothetical protein